MYSTGGKLPESTRDDDSTPLGKIFRRCWETAPLGVVCMPLGNILILRGGILRLSGILLYLLENILILRWGILRPSGDTKLFWG